MEEKNTYSISFRVQKITVEDAFLSIPITDRILKDNEDGTKGIDYEKFVAEAIEISKDHRVEWLLEKMSVEPHSIQSPRPDNRKGFDPSQV